MSIHNKHVQTPQGESSKPANAEKSEAQAQTPSSSASYGAPRGLSISGTSSPDDIPLTRDNLLFLQRSIGNQGVVRLMQKRGILSHPGDAYEGKTDSIQQPMRVGPIIQRKCACGMAVSAPHKECADCQAKRLPVQRQATEAADQSSLPSSVEEVMRSGSGETLPKNIQENMGTALGADLGGVRIHTGPQAARASQDINAAAFTHGQNIYFGAGRYQPDTTDGKRLLAHELTHTIQQRNGAVATAQDGFSVSQPDDPYEQEADRVADQVMAMLVPATAQSAQRDNAVGQKTLLPKPLTNQLSPFIRRSVEPEEEKEKGVLVQASLSDGIQAHREAEQPEKEEEKEATTSIQTKQLDTVRPVPVVQWSHGLQRELIQRKVLEEPQKYTVIDYKKTKADNLKSWYDQYKFYNIFKEAEIYPGSTPIAYANHVYELQMKLEEIYEGKWSAAEAGILEPVINSEGTLYKLMNVALMYHKDPTIGSFGFDTKMLERLSQLLLGFEEKAPPLVSELFSGQRQLEMVNRNKYFYIQVDDRGDYVKQIQLALLALNYNLGSDLKENKKTKEKEPTGVFGKGTKQAVINFQKDSGLEGKDADGVVGQVTLRLLDVRLGAPAMKKPSVAAGNAYGFHVPVTPTDLLLDKEKQKQELLKRTLKVAFPISDEQVDILIRSGWYWFHFDLTQAAVDLGYYEVTIPKSDYESVLGKVDQAAGGKSGEPVEERLGKSAIDLIKTGKLYELNKRISDVESLIHTLRWSGDPEMHGRDVDWASISKYQAELATLKQQRQEELNRLGISLDDYEKMKDDFIATFEKFAALTAFRMLAENEIQANIEAQHYTKMEEVAAIKGILNTLSGKYKESEKLWWEAVSLEDTKGKDKSRYSSGADYKSENTIDLPDGPSIDSSDPTRYFTEENVSNMYKAQEQKPSPYFTSWHDKEKDVVTNLQDSTKKFPILAFPKLELREKSSTYAAMTEGDLQKMLLGIINGTADDKGIKQNIEATRKDLVDNPKKVWELPVVVLHAQYALGVIDGVPAALIKAKQEAVARKGFWESIGLAILGIGLGLLALASGPIGWLALAASITVGAYDAYRTYSDITFKKQTANTALDPASALGTEDPSYFWFWVSLVSVGLDVLQAAKLIKSVAKGIDLAEGVTKGLNEARAAALGRLEKAGGQATAEGKAILKEIEEIDSALSKLKSTDLIENVKLLEPLKANPMAVAVMSEALKDKRIVRAVTSLGKMVEKEMFENALKFYAGVGRKSLDELPELMRLIKEGGLEANKRLMAELLSDPRTQKALLDTQDPKFIAAQFNAWEAAIKAGESKSFVKYLEAENLTSKLASDTRLVDMFGEAFANLPNAVKNRQILRTVEPRLLDALNAGALSPEIRKALEVLLNSDVLAESARLSTAQERLLREIRLLGSVIETQSDFSKVISLLDNPTARRALWDGASQLAGKDKYIEIILKANGGKAPAADVLDDLIRIGPMTDESTIQLLLTESGKKLRQALAASPEAVAALKKCASPCLPPFITPEQVAQVANIMKGQSKDEALRIREFLYANRGTEDSFKSALTSLETNFADALKDVKLPVLTKPAGLAVSDEALRAIVDLGLPVSELNKIMKKASAVKAGSEIITDLMRVLQLEKGVSLKNFDTLIKGLAEGSDAEFRAARHLLDEAERFTSGATSGLTKFKYGGLEKADALLGRFSLAELNSMMSARWSGGGFVNNLYEVVAKLPGASNSEIVELIAKAGGGKGVGDLGRLREILATIKAPSASYDEAVKAIQAADAFAADVAKAMKDPATGYDAMVKLIWGKEVAVEDDVIKVTESIGASGSDAYQTVFQLGKGESIAKSMASGGAVSKDKWKVFRKVIENSNIAPSIKNNIIGEMWTRVNEQAYRQLGYTVYREVEMTAGKTIAKADLVLEKGGEILVVECKSGGATLSKGQEVIYPLLQEGKFKSVMLGGDEALARKFADPNTKIGYLLARE